MRISGYEFADGARFQPGAVGDANEVGKHIDFLREQCKGELTPKDVLDDAKNPNSPLHSFFEWDDSDAAEQYRLQQARGLIRAVVAVYVDDEKPATRIRAFVHVPEREAPHYRSASDAMSLTRTRELVLQRAWRELQAWRKRYADLKELSTMFEAVDETAKKLPKSIR